MLRQRIKFGGQFNMIMRPVSMLKKIGRQKLPLSMGTYLQVKEDKLQLTKIKDYRIHFLHQNLKK